MSRFRALEALKAARRERLAELADRRAGGQKIIGVTCLYVPLELIAATGAVPVRLCAGGAAAAGKGEKYTRNYTCAFIKSCLGLWEQQHPLAGLIDALVMCNTCDQMRKLAEAWYHYFKVPVFLFFNPRGWQRPSVRDIYHGELDWVHNELAALTGQPATPARLAAAVEEYNGVRELLAAIHALRQNDPPPLTGAEWLDLVAGSFDLAPGVYRRLLGEARKELAVRQPPVSLGPRLMLAGGMMAEEDRKLLAAIEGNGRAVVVTDALCTGSRAVLPPIAPDGELRPALYEAYRLRVPCSRARPNDALYTYIKEQIRCFRVDGVIYHTLKFCDSWGGETHRLKTELAKIGVPCLAVDTDYSDGDHAQIQTRVEAFLEMLSTRKR